MVDDDDLLAARQVELLNELAAAVERGGDEEQLASGTCGIDLLCQGCPDYEIFCSHWYRAEAKRKLETEQASCWAWVQRFDNMCAEVCAELDRLLADIDGLDRQRLAVAQATASLRERCEARLREQERLGDWAEAISQRLEFFDAAARITRKLDEDGIMASAQSFSALLDDIDGSVMHLEAHHDFSEAKECFQHFENLRNRACILVRASLQRALKRAEAQVESYLWEENTDEGVDTQVFYAPFQTVAPAQKPFMGLLLRRVRTHRLYLSVLDDLEASFCALRQRLVGDAASEHLMVLRGTRPHPRQLPTLVREAASYLLEAAHRERDLFAAFFEYRQPQDALEALLAQFGKQFYDAVQPAVENCGALDALREAAECLQGELLEPNEEVVGRGGAAAVAFATLVRLRADVCEALLLGARRELAAGVRQHRPAAGDLGWDRLRQSRYPSLDRTLAVLAETYRVLPAEMFEPLAKEAVDSCLASLCEASGLVARRVLPGPPTDDSALLARALDAKLFLIRQLLVLREQLAAIDCDHRHAGRRVLGPPERGPHAALPPCFWSPAASESVGGVRWLRLQRNGAVETTLSDACRELMDGVVARLARPLTAACCREAVDGASGARHADANVEASADEAFLATVREHFAMVAAHVRAHLAEPPTSASAAGEGGAGGIADVFLGPLRERLVAAWRLRPPRTASPRDSAQLEVLLEGTSAEVAAMPFARLLETVAAAPRAPSAGDAAPRLPRTAREPAAETAPGAAPKAESVGVLDISPVRSLVRELPALQAAGAEDTEVDAGVPRRDAALAMSRPDAADTASAVVAAAHLIDPVAAGQRLVAVASEQAPAEGAAQDEPPPAPADVQD